MPMFDLIEYNIYSMTFGSLSNSYKNGINNANDNNVANNRRNNDKTITSKSIKNKAKLIESRPNSNNITAQKNIFPFPK